MPREVCNLPKVPQPGKLAWTLLSAQRPVTHRACPPSSPGDAGESLTTLTADKTDAKKET